eukprot:CAMPEP_0197541178 /NCGR_PEP_ID=MMETSP1318-20131121/67017_1 /TAXON_ID=552666 /ORGANISM="Partenskyella glossopodia, Strain RCC365" /LENGTH=611 /DNA_ID=CAMNT_0043100327 /DNA_START=252 /DNA_END=2087 /DNA_ORIENTATION=-
MFSRPPPNQPIDSPPFPFAELFKVLTPDVAIDVFTALLLEYRVVMVSTPYTNLTLVSELLIRLMYPFSYEHVYIPILPKTLMEFLAAPMPFCIGVPREFLEISDLKDILEDKENMIIVDLDHNQVISNVPLTRLPRAELTKLQKRLKPLSKLYVPRENMSPLQRKAFDGRDSAFNYIPSPEELDFINQSIPSINDGEVTSVQAAFLRVFVSIFKDYRRFLIQRDDASKSPKSAAPGTTHQTNDEQTEGKHPFERCASAPTNESMCPGMFMEEPAFKTAFDGRDSAFNYIPSPEELDFINQSIPSINDGEVTSVQAAFLRVFVSIFKDYRRFLIQRDDASKSPKSAAPGTTHQTNDEQTEGKHPFESYHTRCASAPTNESMCPGMFMEEPAFKTDEYIRKATKDARPFLTKFLDTQAFLRFADQRVCGGPLPGEVENFDIKFFDEAIIAKNNRSRFRFSKPTPFLQSKTYDITETLPAPDPDTSGLTEGRIYQHDYFPRLDPDLFQAVKIETTKPLMEKIDKLAPRTTLHPLRNSSRKMRRMHTDSSIPNLVRQLSQQKLNANSKSGRRQRTLSRVSRSFLAELSHIVKPPELVEHPDMDRNDHSSRRRLSS